MVGREVRRVVQVGPRAAPHWAVGWGFDCEWLPAASGYGCCNVSWAARNLPVVGTIQPLGVVPTAAGRSTHPEQLHHIPVLQ